MLERYHEEVQRKKFAYRIFWFVVLAFATLLYMFFQGYYFSMQVGFERLMHVGKENSYSTGSNDSMVKPFGIINIKVDPSPNLLTINDQKYQNGDKSIFDYGNYTIEIAEDGFLPIQIKTILDRQVPFYINSIRLIRTPVSREIPLSREANSIGTDILLKNASGSYTLSSTSFSGMTTVGTGGITYRDEWIFSLSGKLFTLSDETTLSPSSLLKTNELLCPEARIVAGEVFCEKSGVMLTGKYKGLREKIIEATPALIRTSSNLIRVGGTFFNSSTPIPSNISLSGSSTLVDLKGRTLLQNNGRLYDLEKGFTEVKIPGLQDIRYVETFGDEAILLGTGSGGTEILVKDVQEKEIHLAIPQITLEWVQVSQYSGAYIISTKKEVFIYYKGGTRIIPLVTGDILGIFDQTIVYNKDGKTFALSLEG